MTYRNISHLHRNMLKFKGVTTLISGAKVLRRNKVAFKHKKGFHALTEEVIERKTHSFNEYFMDKRLEALHKQIYFSF